jgi:hypothetical protein
VALRRVCDMDRVDCLSSTHAALLPLIVRAARYLERGIID